MMWLKNYHFLTLITFGILLSEISIYAQETFLDELQPGTKTSFKHWNVESSGISGYSHFRQEIVTRDSKKFIVEKNENTKADGEVFTRKSLWFGANSGIPEWYEEEDLRNDFRIKNFYLGHIMRTRLEKAGTILEFETNLSQENAIPFEVVIFFLRKNIKHILHTKNYSFTLFLPLLAIELKEKGLPHSMSMIKMNVKPLEKLNLETPLGKIIGYHILVLPKSRFLRAMLPKDKTHFKFIFAEAKPHYLLQFTAGKTRHILTQLKLAK